MNSDSVKSSFLPLCALATLLLSAPVVHAAAPSGEGDGVLRLRDGGYASLPSASVRDLDYTRDFSVEAVIRIEAYAAGGRWAFIVGKMYSPPLTRAGFALGINQGQFKAVGQSVYATVADGTNKVAVGSTIPFEGTVQAIMTWNATSRVLTLFANGTIQGQQTNSAIVPAAIRNTDELRVGGPSNHQQPLERDILLGRLWNRQLSGSEVLALWTEFNATRRHQLPPGFDRSGLHSEWLMDETSDAVGGAGATHIKDNVGANHLGLVSPASLWQADGPLQAVAPPDRATGIVKAITLRAAGGFESLSADAVHPLRYQFEIDEVPSFDSTALKDSDWQDHYGQWQPILKPSTTYYWRVRVSDSSPTPVVSDYTPTRSFTTKAATTWFVRPSVHISFSPHTGVPVATSGVYGLQDGTSYENAWNGLSSVVWGEGGVEAGDTLYVCGRHLYSALNANFLAEQALCRITASGFSDEYPISIRMDYETDPGEMWGAFSDLSRGEPQWLGPDANGVYSCASLSFGAWFGLNSPGISLLHREQSPTWTGNLGAAYSTNGIWYVKTQDGTNPAGKILSRDLGYRFHIGRSHFIRFLNCRFHNAVPRYERFLHCATALPVSTHITFNGCELRYGTHVELYRGHDDWTFRESTLSDSVYGVYTMGNDGAGANRLTIAKCHIYNMGTELFPHQDAHGIGVQGGEGHIIEGNRIEDTGAAIEFWTASQPMRNHTIRNNFIRNIHVKQVTGGGGIIVSGDNNYAVVGLRTGFKIYGNIIVNTGLGATEDWQGSGIGGNCRDYIEICNNVIVNARKAINLGVVGKVPEAKIMNNIVVNPTTVYLWVTGAQGVATNLTVDHNLFFPATDLDSRFVVYPLVPHNQNSVFADPRFISGSGQQPDDFRLQSISPAIDAGADVGLSWDFVGTAIPQGLAPDIGAFEFAQDLVQLPSPTNLRVIGSVP